MTKPNPFAYPKAITLDNLSDLFAHHRERSGGWSMTNAPAEPNPPSDPPADPPPADPPGYNPPASQADLDRIVQQRLARERERFADYDDLKKKAEAHDAALEAAKSDADRAIDAARKDGETSALERVNSRLVTSEIRTAAALAKFRDPADALAHVDRSKITVSDSGEVDVKAITDQLDTLATSKPYLVDDGKRPAPRSDPSQGNQHTPDSPSVNRGREMYQGNKKTT